MNQQDPGKNVAILLFVLLLLGSLFLAYERVGLLPWVSVLLSGVGLALMAVLRGRRTLYCFILIASLIGMSWAGSLYYVFSTWESGEVVEIQLKEDVVFRTWVVESGGEEMVIYDCPPEYQALVEASAIASLGRGNERYTADLRAEPVEFDSEALSKVYALYEEKYASQSRATEMYYLLIGPRRGSQIYVLHFTRRDT